MATSLTLAELANRTGGKILCGEPALSFHGIDSLDTATADDISFLGNEKYVPQFHATSAGAVIVPKGYDFKFDGPALIAVENPTLAFSEAVSFFATQTGVFTPGFQPGALVSPLANVDPKTVSIAAGAVIMEGAQIGAGSSIGPNAVVMESTVIGEDCRICANVTISRACTIGDRVIIHPGTVIGSDGYGYELVDGRHVKIDQVGIVEIHDDVEIGSNTTIDRARFGKTRIGEGTKIDNLVQIGHNATIGKHCLIISQVGIAGSANIEDYVTIAAQAGIAGHITIGEGSVLAARAGATTDLKGGVVYAGKPALPMKEETKLQASVRRLPQLRDRVKALEIALKNQTS